MTKKLLSLIIIVILVIGGGWFLYAEYLQIPTIISDFDELNSDGWTIIGDAQGGTSIPTFNEYDGFPGGYISATDDQTGGTWYFKAPEKFKGDRSDYFGRTFSYFMKRSEVTNPFFAPDIIIEGNGLNLIYMWETTGQKTEWGQYSIGLSEDFGWKVNRLEGAYASDNEIKEVLKDVRGIQIRGEYTDGPDTAGLDNVVLR